MAPIYSKRGAVRLWHPLNLNKTQYRTKYIILSQETREGGVDRVYDIKGLDHSEKVCSNLGLLSIKYSIEDMQQTLGMLKSRGLQSVDVNDIQLQPYGDISIFLLPRWSYHRILIIQQKLQPFHLAIPVIIWKFKHFY